MEIVEFPTDTGTDAKLAGSENSEEGLILVGSSGSTRSVSVGSALLEENAPFRMVPREKNMQARLMVMMKLDAALTTSREEKVLIESITGADSRIRTSNRVGGASRRFLHGNNTSLN
jgi:hypothetical protein